MIAPGHRRERAAASDQVSEKRKGQPPKRKSDHLQINGEIGKIALNLLLSFLRTKVCIYRERTVYLSTICLPILHCYVPPERETSEDDPSDVGQVLCQ